MPGRKNREAEVAVIRPAQPRTTLRAVAATEHRLAGAFAVPIEQVLPDPAQPRQDWSHGDGVQRLDELAASIAEFGILQPLIVREDGALPDGRQRYLIIAGGRRYAAAHRVGLTELPVVVRSEELSRVRVLQLLENLQRQDLSPLDEARAYQEFIDVEGLTPPMVAARLHVSAQHVRDRLRVLNDQVLADAVERGQVTATVARDILQLPDEEKLALRTRVQRGELLQTGDVITARARLTDSGIVNSRRKRERPEKQTSFVPALETTREASEIQTSFVSSTATGTAGQELTVVSRTSSETAQHIAVLVSGGLQEAQRKELEMILAEPIASSDAAWCLEALTNLLSHLREE